MTIQPIFSTVVTDPVHFWVFGLVVNYYNSFGARPSDLDLLAWYSGLHGYGGNYRLIQPTIAELVEKGYLKAEDKYDAISPSATEAVYTPNPNFVA